MSNTPSETTKVTETGPSKTVEKTTPVPQPDQGGSGGGQSGGNGGAKPNG